MKTIEHYIYLWKDPVPSPLVPSDFSLPSEDLAWKVEENASEALDRAKGRYLSKVYRLPQPWRMVYTFITLDMQVNNGGFHQFFTNTAGALDQHLMDDAYFLASENHLSIISSAWHEYPQIDYSGQWDNLGNSWEHFAEAYKDGRFEQQDDLWYKTEPSICQVIGGFIKANQSLYL